MRILITGAGGFIGRRLARAALDRGDVVRTLTRREWDGWPGVPLKNRYFGRLPFAWDEDAVKGVDVVIHCAADASSELNRARAVNVTGTAMLAEAARASGASFVFLSTQSPRADAPTAYGRSKYEAEQVLASTDGLALTIVRPGLVCGPGGLFGRVAAMARRLPFVPSFSPNALIQPIWIDDLLAALLRLAGDPSDAEGSPVPLGLVNPERLGRLVGAVARQLQKPVIPFPDAAVMFGVSTLEAMGLRPPLQRANLRQMAAVVALDSEQAMRRLGIPDRSLDEIVELALSEATTTDPERTHRARRVALVGAGRIGLVHAATLSGLSGAVLSAVVDRNAAQVRLLRSLGIPNARASTLEEALGASDAAVIATPPSSHLALTRSALERGLDVLVEKPAVSRSDDLDEFSRMAHEARGRTYVGYVMLAAPHVLGALARLRRGDYGSVTDFTGLTLLSLVDPGSSSRWETDQSVSGGGVVANSAPHVLSVISEAFGKATRIDTEMVRLVSRSVEDSAVSTLAFPALSGVHYSSWSITGYERQENRLSIRTDKGELVITTALTAFRSNEGSVEVDHQLDHGGTFNVAPDYSGAGIAAELHALTNGEGRTAASADHAVEIERQLFSMYEHARFASAFTLGTDGGGGSAVATAQQGRTAAPSARKGLILDARSAAVLGTPPEDLAWSRDWDGVEVDTSGLRHALRHIDEPLLRVTVPNFLPSARLLSERRYADVVRAMGLNGFLRAGVQTAAALPREKGLTFWAGAIALVTAELAQIPRTFRGVVLLHPYVADLAIALERYEQLENLLGILSARCGRIGLHSNLGVLAANALCLLTVTPQVLSLLASPRSSHVISGIRRNLDAVDRLRGIHLTAEVGPAPVFVHRAAADASAASVGADSTLLSALVDDHVFAAARVSMRTRWRIAFPGVELPSIVTQ